ncbi:chloramphenicol phosphotransferase [Nakamurella silvestris]|nr:chloramphenicol phosphotransferase [Nakamurella silvestris]
MRPDVYVLNGISSSGKSSIARQLQNLLPETYLRFSVDDFVDALPERLTSGEQGIGFGSDGRVQVDDTFVSLERSWTAGIAAIARAGTGVILDDVFLGGTASQERTRTGLAGLNVCWVGIHCDLAVAVEREAARGDRAPGMAASQIDLVHRGVGYDVEVDSTDLAPAECAARIVAAAAAALGGRNDR